MRGCRKRAEVRIRVGLIVGPTVLSCQYSFLVHFHILRLSLLLLLTLFRALPFIFSAHAILFHSAMLGRRQIRCYLYCLPLRLSRTTSSFFFSLSSFFLSPFFSFFFLSLRISHRTKGFGLADTKLAGSLYRGSTSSNGNHALELLLKTSLENFHP